MNVVDIILIVFILIFVSKGFSNGVFKEAVTFIGGIAVIGLAFIFKNPVSVFMYKTLPFFKFSGILSGITVVNIIVYELLAFLLVASILLILYQAIVKVTNIVEKILKITFVFALPSKILGAILGFAEGVVFTFVILFLCLQFELTRPYINSSKYGNVILEGTPVLSDVVSPIYDSLKEIYEVADNYKDLSEAEDRNRANLECLEVLLKYKVLDVANADFLMNSEKIMMPGAEEIIDKYRGTK